MAYVYKQRVVLVFLLIFVSSEYYIKEPKKESPDEVNYSFNQVAYAEIDGFSHFKNLVF